MKVLSVAAACGGGVAKIDAARSGRAVDKIDFGGEIAAHSPGTQVPGRGSL
jgi:hypothetical protein